MRIPLRAASLAATAFAFLPVPAAAQVPWQVQGRLEANDAQDGEHRRYDDNAVLLTAGTRYRISAESASGEGGFDTILQVRRPGAADTLAENDDFGEGLNSRVIYTADRTATYIIRVLSFSAEGRGAYTARVEQLPPLPPPSTAAPSSTARTTWRIWDGELAADDADNNGKHYDDYLVHMNAGETRMIAADAVGEHPTGADGEAGMDLVVQVLRPNQREGDPIDSDDDGGPGFNALLGFTPTETGDYIVRVTSFGDGTTGRYRLRISDPD